MQNNGAIEEAAVWFDAMRNSNMEKVGSKEFEVWKNRPTPGRSVQCAGSVVTRPHPPEAAESNLHAKCVGFTLAKCRPP